MKFAAVVHSLPESICKEFERALKEGTWSNGIPLTRRQQQICRDALECRYGRLKLPLH